MFDATKMHGPPEPIAAASRRSFLKAAAATAGTLLIGFRLSAATAADATSEVFAPDAFIRIFPSGKITLIMPQVEMGQGIYTAVAMILAEELDAAFDQITLEAAPPNDALYANPALGLQATGGSTSVRAFWTPLRKAAAGARSLLVAAAAKVWGVDPATCRTAKSEVLHDASGRKLAYGALVGAAAGMTPPKDPPLKPPADFQLVGKPLKRLDTPDKVNGKARFGIDAMPPGVKFATLAACPVFGGKVGRVDDSKAKGLPGVRQVIVLDDLVAVVGDHMWAAVQGLDALKIVWDEGANASVSSAQVWEQIRRASEKEGAVAKTVGDPAKSLASGEAIDAAYELPFLAHAPMEPMNCTVHLTPDSCEIWVGSQVLARAQAVAAKVSGLPLDKVVVHNHLLGGGFGRRLEVDYVEKAVRIAQKVDGPVKVVWTREEDIQHDIYRPVYRDQSFGCLSDGKIVGWRHRIAGSSIMARWLPPAFKNGVDIDAVDSAADLPYEIPNLRVEYVRDEPPAVPTGFWRGVGPNNNVFAIESFMDELAKKTGKDPIAFRREMLGKNAAPDRGHRPGGEQGGLGRRAAGEGRPRNCGSDLVRKLYRDRRRGGSGQRRRSACATRRLGRGCGNRRQSRHRHRATAGGPDLRHHGRALRRNHDRKRQGPAKQFQRLSHVADRSDPGDRDPSHQERRGPWRHWRDRNHRRASRHR